MSEPAYHVLYSCKDPERYIIGRDDINEVWLFNPDSQMSPGRPVPLASIGNHMPHAQWEEFTGDDSAILAKFDRTQK